MMERQPMDTAPKDGTDVLLFRDKGMPPIVAGWFEAHPYGGDWYSFDDPDSAVRGDLVGWSAIPEVRQ